MKPCLMLVALSITLATANAAPKPPNPIASVPIRITAPGSYYFISNMFYTPTSLSDSTAITINSPGEVTIDLRGFTLTGPPQAYAGGYYLNPNGIVIYSSNVTVKNGTIAGFSHSLMVNQFTGESPKYISDVDIQAITFNGGLYDSIQLNAVNNSIVRDCNFIGSNFSGILADGSQTGNRYIKDTFNGPPNPISITNSVPIILNSITPLKKDNEK
jgi:hypothetical protein